MARTLVDLLQQQAERYSDRVAFSFSYNGDDENRSQLSYRQLDLAARAIGARLQQLGAAGQRVLVFCRPGLDGVIGFFGCVYAGAVAVPIHQKLAPRLSSVVPDAQARFVVAAAQTRANIGAAVDLLTHRDPVQWVVIDDVVGDAGSWMQPRVDADAVAFVQYTSGSTRAPNGVLVSHANLLHNVDAIHQTWRGDDNDVCVFWLPQHHDMGLIGGVLHSVYVGCTTHLMSPSAFIQRPMRWLEAISRYGGCLTAAPNFAYDLCVERSTAEERAALDLSRWRVAMNGSEPVRAETLRAFSAAFAPARFRIESFMPVYGLAEATLLVSGGSDPAPVVLRVDRGALEEDRVVCSTEPGALELVGCGLPRGDQRIVIVDPDTLRRCEADQVGEIWIAGPSVAQGYWGKPDETEQTFAAHLADTGDGPFLRTGDLGFLRGGELFVTGRVKDLIVLGGRNYYPHDVESTVQDCHPALLRGRGAIFAVAAGPDSLEQLVVVQEADDGRAGATALPDLVDALRAAITGRHRIQPDAVFLVEPMRIPTTSSGKIRRGTCREQLLGGELEGTVEWYAPQPSAEAAQAKTREAAAKVAALLQAASELQRWESDQG